MNINKYYTYFASGQVKSVITKMNDENHGIEQEYDFNGTVIHERLWYKGVNRGWVSKL
jgi:antitoxin component YwqK of YwqJK toxin-antitoxin module